MVHIWTMEPILTRVWAIKLYLNDHPEKLHKNYKEASFTKTSFSPLFVPISLQFFRNTMRTIDCYLVFHSNDYFFLSIQELGGATVHLVENLPKQLENSSLTKTSALGLLGIPGLTAYIGLMELGKPKVWLLYVYVTLMPQPNLKLGMWYHVSWLLVMLYKLFIGNVVFYWYKSLCNMALIVIEVFHFHRWSIVRGIYQIREYWVY